MEIGGGGGVGLTFMVMMGWFERGAGGLCGWVL